MHVLRYSVSGTSASGAGRWHLLTAWFRERTTHRNGCDGCDEGWAGEGGSRRRPHDALIARLCCDTEVDRVADEDGADAAAVVCKLLERLRQRRRELGGLLEQHSEPRVAAACAQPLHAFTVMHTHARRYRHRRRPALYSCTQAVESRTDRIAQAGPNAANGGSARVDAMCATPQHSTAQHTCMRRMAVSRA